MSNLDMALGDIMKQNKKKAPGGRGGATAARGGRQGTSGIAKGKRQATKQAGTTNQRQAKKGAAQPSQKKPRQHAKQNNAKQMNTAGRQSRQTVTANRQSSARDQKLTKLRGQQPVASQQPMLVYYDANGQQVLQPVAVIQQPGQAGAQVIPTGTATKGPMFKAANRQPNQQQAAGGARRQSASGNQRQAAARGGRGGRRN